ncbi:hypothetical protein QFC22_000038 [Naganishia vaughanmartiniae]|uniref:Uncharacterized protein n=1 Tax=Naganishia vaughanmartiniae TaxID=1424756 RepID=A0ACC2XNY8_9TREE|nr:hypothetical protein QFC22_000038 [Naganishia vaughanmartiniae]
MKLSDKQLAGLKLYKYSGVDKSILSKTILTPYWNNLVKLFPRYIAPNTITLMGLTMIFINIVTLLWFDPKYDGHALPSWVYWSFSIGLFIYQSMDAIDGKQARRTGMAGPLGEMFDHGCDAINVTLEVILAQAAFGYTRSWWTIASQAAAISNFYLSTWEEYHTGSLYLSAFSGPVEGILLICVMFAITAVKGPAFWTTPIIKTVPYICNVLDRRLQMLGGKGKVMDMTPMGKGMIPVLNLSQLGAKLYTSMSSVGWLRDLSIREAFMWFGAVGMLGNIVNAYVNVIVARRKQKLPLLTPLLGLLPFLAHIALLVSWLAGPGVEIVHSVRMLPFIAYWGACFAYQVSKLILAHVTKSPFPYWNGMMLWSALGAIDANAPLLFGREPFIQNTEQKATYFVLASMVIAILNYLRFAKSVIWQITDFTGLACFTVRHKDEQGGWVDNQQAVDDRKKR